MRPTEPLQLHHSWPLAERAAQFRLGCLLDADEAPPFGTAPPALDDPVLARHGIGRWECDLSDNSLSWSPEVYDIFGLPPGAPISRADSVALYREDSRAAMERLRAYAIKHRRGFTLDVNIRPAQGSARWMRLIAVPVCDGRRVVRLHGLKQNLSRSGLEPHPPMDFRPPRP